MQAADAVHVVPTAVATMVLHVTVTVKDIMSGSKAGAVDTHVPQNFPLETGTARGMLIPMPRSEGRHNSKKECLELPNACSYPCHAQKAGTTHRWCVIRCQG